MHIALLQRRSASWLGRALYVTDNCGALAALPPRTAKGRCRVDFEPYGMKRTVLPMFSAYWDGPRRRVVWDVDNKAVGGSNEIRLFAQGAESRDFIHAEDVATAVCHVAQQVDWHNVYNVASGTEVSIRQLADQILAIIPDSPALHFDGRAIMGMPTRWRADITRMRELGYEPTRRWQEGVHEVVAACLREVART